MEDQVLIYVLKELSRIYKLCWEVSINISSYTYKYAQVLSTLCRFNASSTLAVADCPAGFLGLVYLLFTQINITM